MAEAAEVRLTAAACGMRTRHATPTAGRLMQMKNSIGEPAAAGAMPTPRLKKEASSAAGSAHPHPPPWAHARSAQLGSRPLHPQPLVWAHSGCYTPYGAWMQEGTRP